VLAVCATLGQLDYFAALVFQQHDEQSALRKGRGHNVVLSVSVVRRWTIFAGFAGFAYGTLVVRSGRASSQSRWTRLANRCSTARDDIPMTKYGGGEKSK